MPIPKGILKRYGKKRGHDDVVAILKPLTREKRASCLLAVCRKLKQLVLSQRGSHDSES